MGDVELTAGKAVRILVEYTNTSPPDGPEADRSQPALMRGMVSKVLYLRVHLVLNLIF